MFVSLPWEYFSHFWRAQLAWVWSRRGWRGSLTRSNPDYFSRGTDTRGRRFLQQKNVKIWTNQTQRWDDALKQNHIWNTLYNVAGFPLCIYFLEQAKKYYGLWLTMNTALSPDKMDAVGLNCVLCEAGSSGSCMFMLWVLDQVPIWRKVGPGSLWDW